MKMGLSGDELRLFFEQFQDHCAPLLDTYEQAVYLYIFRHSRLIGKAEVVIGFKSARTRMACGIGQDGSPMSENSAYQRIASLQQKGLLTVVQTEHKGRRLRLHLPHEIPGLVPSTAPVDESPNIEAMDFFADASNRLAIFRRENGKCFYMLRPIDEHSFVIDHVVSRPHGDNGYRNVVSACREANNRKGAMPAEDFLRRLFREGFLSAEELEERMAALSKLRAGELKPVFATEPIT